MKKIVQQIKQIRCNIITWSTHKLALPVIRILIRPGKFPYSVNDLREMPDGSMGRELLIFLETYKLHLLTDYESHDIKHTLLSYPADEEGEAGLQYFMLGNGQRSFPVLITVLVSYCTMPEYHQSFRKAYSRGQKTPRLRGTNWFALMPLPYHTVLQQLNIPDHE